ncbi:MAG: histidine kinase [Reichenbachiella sp.]
MKQKRNREIRYHIIFWVLYILLWSARDLIYDPSFLGNFIINTVFNISVAPFVYFNLYFLVPKYLLKERWGIYGAAFAVGFVLALISRFYTYQFVFVDIIHVMEVAEKFNSSNGLVIIGSENVVLVMMTMALFMIREWYGKERYARELEKKNAESELDMLKSQLQPHFLFNNLNTIYFLMETNPALAKEMMLQFSDVLSHQLYNAKKDKVLLKEELTSLESFLKIQMLRHQDFLTLEYDFPDDTGQLEIAPMILLTFIENSFKHSQREDGYFIKIKVAIDDHVIHLQVVNSMGTFVNEEKGGIGLENVQRRLSLIYPDQHQLTIEQTEELYTIDLKITLADNGKD